MEIDKVTVGLNIKKLREEKNMTQSVLAEKTNTTITNISNYERGQRYPSLVSAANLAMALDASIDSLYFGCEDNVDTIKANSNGRRVVNCVYFLWEIGVLKNNEVNCNPDMRISSPILIGKYQSHIRRLIRFLDDYSVMKSSMKDAHSYLEQYLDSIAAQIDRDM